MLLVMFDVDGTLVRGNGIDDVCFSEAIKDVLKVCQIDTDWSHYSNVTDSGITSEIIKKHLSRRAKQNDINLVRQSYLKRLQHEIRSDSQIFQATPGASELITDLLSMEGVCVTIATGGWRDSALLKLEKLGISLEKIPITSSDDAHQRESIMKRSYEFAQSYANCKEFQPVVYIGDHLWDYVNSKKLGYNFVGIASGNQALELRHAGVMHVIPDFTDRDYCLEVLGVDSHTPASTGREEEER